VSIDPSGVRFGADGLAPAIVQDAADGRVLMLAWMDAEALSATLATGEVHFHSRSRDSLWRKGETSGNVLRLRDIAVDCDADALLVTAEPVGPTCHRGTRSCFDAAPAATPDERPARSSGASDPGRPSVAAAANRQPSTSTMRDGVAIQPPGDQGFAWLESLWATIASRAAERPAGSYTTQLVDGGVDTVARKVTEEATEVVLAAKDDAAAEVSGADRLATGQRIAEETADLLYHALVILAERGVKPRDVIATLEQRHR
jgi:phosphoribosyl-ATP pyrophosphohydrolase/phosphoribosyl-AMP cyclohydrolase